MVNIINYKLLVGAQNVAKNNPTNMKDISIFNQYNINETLIIELRHLIAESPDRKVIESLKSKLTTLTNENTALAKAIEKSTTAQQEIPTKSNTANQQEINTLEKDQNNSYNAMQKIITDFTNIQITQNKLLTICYNIGPVPITISENTEWTIFRVLRHEYDDDTILTSMNKIIQQPKLLNIKAEAEHIYASCQPNPNKTIINYMH